MDYACQDCKKQEGAVACEYCGKFLCMDCMIVINEPFTDLFTDLCNDCFSKSNFTENDVDEKYKKNIK